MLSIVKDSSFNGEAPPFGAVEVVYPERAQWQEAAFQALQRQELAGLLAAAPQYDRQAVFGQDPYYRYFKKFKKTYTVMMQLESFLLKGRPFPQGNPINEGAFLAELKTHVLLGAHDVDRIAGPVVLFRGAEKVPFAGMGGREVHIYPGDVSGRDDEGIIFSMIAGADQRTCLSPATRHVAYLVFATPQTPPAQVQAVQQLLAQYARVLAPAAQVRSLLV